MLLEDFSYVTVWLKSFGSSSVFLSPFCLICQTPLSSRVLLIQSNMGSLKKHNEIYKYLPDQIWPGMRRCRPPWRGEWHKLKKVRRAQSVTCAVCFVDVYCFLRGFPIHFYVHSCRGCVLPSFSASLGTARWVSRFLTIRWCDGHTKRLIMMDEIASHSTPAVFDAF